MLRPIFRAAAMAVSLAAPVATIAIAQINTAPVNGTTFNVASIGYVAAPSMAKDQSRIGDNDCRVKIVSYFDDQNLVQIDKDLASVRNKIVNMGLHDIFMDEQFNMLPKTSDTALLRKNFLDMFRLEYAYQPGKSESLNYLQNPYNVPKVINTYANYIESLRAIIGDQGSRNIFKGIDQTMFRLSMIAYNTTNLMDEQRYSNCPALGQ